ncbi:hypothetical protein HGRIS_009119 [Hohenbuehelia grisea]|uniref:Peroxin-12 n=1 Tax=Hohenbuehelia grisea TaxID=104357 RepID=A0ABR3J069_9AGAR
MPDAFANWSNITINGGTFSNVAGNQTVTTYNYHITPGALAPISTFRPAQGIGADRLPSLPLPTTSPYQDLVHVINAIQRALSPLEELYHDARPLASLFGPLRAQLDELFQSAAFVGSVVEMVEAITPIHFTQPFPEYLFLQVRSRVVHYTSTLTMFLGDITRYRHGLRDTAVGPVWLRILWFIFRATSDRGIEAVLFDMNTEVDQFQKPLKQFLFVVQSMRISIGCQWLSPMQQEAFRNLLRTLKSGLPLFKDVILDFVTIEMVDNGPSIEIPLLWCSSMQDLSAILFAKSSYRSWYAVSNELMHTDLRSSGFASVTPGVTMKSAILAFGVVFHKDIPNLCPKCRTSIDVGVTPCTSWIMCRYCGMEYSLRIEEYSRTGQPSKASALGGAWDDSKYFHFPRLVRNT